MMVEHPARTQMGKQENSQIVETAKEARGAELGPTIRNVLVWSLSWWFDGSGGRR
jgi:hypothetical protein